MSVKYFWLYPLSLHFLLSGHLRFGNFFCVMTLTFVDLILFVLINTVVWSAETMAQRRPVFGDSIAATWSRISGWKNKKPSCKCVGEETHKWTLRIVYASTCTGRILICIITLIQVFICRISYGYKNILDNELKAFIWILFITYILDTVAVIK